MRTPYCNNCERVLENLKTSQQKLEAAEAERDDLSSLLDDINEYVIEADKERDTLAAKVKELEAQFKCDTCNINDLAAQNARLRELLEMSINNLEGYSLARRDKSFEGWEKEWREVEIKHESDYEFYPNHITKEEIAAARKALASDGRDGMSDES